MSLCAADSDGMGVSLIQSNASGFGCLVFEPSTGIGLHNRGIGFSLSLDTRRSTALVDVLPTRSRLS